jgi:sulfofructose kinase
VQPTVDVVGFGENSIDYVYRLSTLPTTEMGKLRVQQRSAVPGGQVATTMAACAGLGLRAAYVGSFGHDEGSALVRAELEAHGVDLRHSMVREAANRYAVILVDERDGERIVLWDRDERLKIRPADVRAEWIAGARLVHVDAVDEDASVALANAARDAAIPVTSDIDDVSAFTEELIAAVTIPIVAEPLAVALTGESDPERALRKLRRRHGGLLVVTLGSRGAMLLDGDHLHHEPAAAVDVVDTTGAGDAFRAGFIYALLQGSEPSDLLRVANAAAAVSCTRAGAMRSVPTLAEVQRLVPRLS